MADVRHWSPTHIDIEPAFNEFVPTFRNGQLIRDLMPDPSRMPLNADYLFPNDDVIAELKCLEKNPMEAADWSPRLAKAFKSTGHTFSDLMGYLFRGEPMPDNVRARLVEWLRASVRNVVKVGNRQIRASKRELRKPNAKGVLLIANDNNYGFGPEAMLAVISDAAVLLDDSHTDAVVYFTPNVFHRLPGSDVAWTIWDPRYRDETDVQLSEFVNDMGRKWNDRLEVISGDTFVERHEAPHFDRSSMQPVLQLARGRNRHGDPTHMVRSSDVKGTGRRK